MLLQLFRRWLKRWDRLMGWSRYHWSWRRSAGALHGLRQQGAKTTVFARDRIKANAMAPALAPLVQASKKAASMDLICNNATAAGPWGV